MSRVEVIMNITGSTSAIQPLSNSSALNKTAPEGVDVQQEEGLSAVEDVVTISDEARAAANVLVTTDPPPSEGPVNPEWPPS